jgi:hypothetical protein
LFKPVGDPKYDNDHKVLFFDAQLLRDFAGGRAGDIVQVTLDLFGSTSGEGLIHVQNPKCSTFVALPAQLLLGQSFSDAAALQKLLKPDAAE